MIEPTIISPPSDEGKAKGAKGPWIPKSGDEVARLLKRKEGIDPKEKKAIELSAQDILKGGINPNDNHLRQSRTGLVIGRVQSGKTMSFTTVAALARDNGFPLVIAITGSSTHLSSQSEKRFLQDLDIEDREGSSRWKLHSNPGEKERELFKIQLQDRLAGRAAHTLLVVVMKHYGHLNELVKILRQVPGGSFPTLIIDDEADQGGLNTSKQGERPSRTYQELLSLREAVTPNTYLQYTATPQAPLLINVFDHLSPDYVRLLKPGSGYIGGKELFKLSDNPFVEVIPSKETRVSKKEAIPPRSLLLALRIYLLGMAAEISKHSSGSIAKRSMLVHPSIRQKDQVRYYNWIWAVINEWKDTLSSTSRPEKYNSLKMDFAEAHKNLARTVCDILPFDSLFEEFLPAATESLLVKLVNSKSGVGPEDINWNQHYNWLLVGGRALDRGVTLEGLTVSYMPRNTENSNADTVQQLGRFFGYKKSYLGACRLFLSNSLQDQFADYVDHEESLLDELSPLSEDGQDIKEWTRQFRLSENFNSACRKTVIDKFTKGSYGNKWVEPQNYTFINNEVASDNRRLINDFIADVGLVHYMNISKGSAPIRKAKKGLPLSAVCKNFLSGYRLAGDKSDSEKFLGAIFQINHYLKKNKSAAFENCNIFIMNEESAPRFRMLDDEDKLVNLYRGRDVGDNPSYPGDAKILEEGMKDNLAIQIHYLNLDPDRLARRNPRHSCVPVIAIWIPEKMRSCWLTQKT